MREYESFKVFTQMREIKEIQTMLPPEPDEIRLHPSCEGKTAGFAIAIYNRKVGMWQISYYQTESDCIAHIRSMKSATEFFPEVFGSWATDYSDMYIFVSDGYIKPNWGLHGIVIED